MVMRYNSRSYLSANKYVQSFCLLKEDLQRNLPVFTSILSFRHGIQVQDTGQFDLALNGTILEEVELQDVFLRKVA